MDASSTSQTSRSPNLPGSDVSVELRGAIAIVRLQRPHKRNALSDGLMAQVDAAFASLPRVHDALP